MKFWWVNQNQTFRHQVAGGYLWSPKRRTDGARNRFYDAMTETSPGDLVFSYCDTQIKAIGVITGPCQSAPKPTEFGSAGSYWSDEGWYVPVDYTVLRSPIRPKDHMARIAPTLPEKYSPLQPNGNGLQSVYLAPLPVEMVAVITDLLGGQVEEVISSAVPEDTHVGDLEQSRILADETLRETERVQLIRARVGQGIFRSMVLARESRCRVTGTSDPRFLRASHIKPWAVSDSAEKLDGENGLMLAPHVDALFDAGFISFEDDGSLIVSSKLPASLLADWGLVVAVVSIPFRTKQAQYMAYHRAIKLKR